MKLKLIKKLAIDTIGPAGVSIQHAISLDVRGDAKDLLCPGVCPRRGVRARMTGMCLLYVNSLASVTAEG